VKSKHAQVHFNENGIPVADHFDDVYFSNEPIELETWAKRYNIQVKGNPFFSDGVHPSKLTYQVWAKDMASFIHKNY